MSKNATQINDAHAPYLSTAEAHDVPPGYRQAEVGVIPEDWALAPIRKVAPLQRGFDLPKSQIQSGVVYANWKLTVRESRGDSRCSLFKER